MVSDDEPVSLGAGAIVKVVGPCKSGKSTLVAGLKAVGYAARSCSQEHSETPTMWLRIVPPDCLIFLDVSLASMRARADRSDWSEGLLATQQRRLAHARQHADLIIATDAATPQQVLGQALDFLERSGLRKTAQGFASSL